MSNPFYAVAWVRTDGGAHETTFFGFAAESCASQFFAQLRENSRTLFAAVIQRHDRAPISWEVVARYEKVKEPDATDGGEAPDTESPTP